MGTAGGISGGYLVVATHYIGYSGTAVFTQSGGSNTVSDVLYLGYNAGYSGTYDLSNNGQVSAQWEYVGYYGTGTFMHHDGSNSVSRSLYLGYRSWRQRNVCPQWRQQHGIWSSLPWVRHRRQGCVCT